MSSDPNIWYRDRDHLKIGDVNRYSVRYVLQNPEVHEIYFRLKNIELIPVRAIHLLNGPFILYCHVVPHNYDYHRLFHPESDSNKEVVFAHQIKPRQSFNVKLCLNENSRVKDNIYQWEIDIISQIVITKSTTVGFDLLIGDDLHRMKKLHRGGINTISNIINDIDHQNPKYEYPIQKSTNSFLTVEKLRTEDIWTNTPKNPDEPIHLVILTHGIFSNVTADMLFLKDSLEAKVDENLLIKGYPGNAAKTEKGVKRLGMGVGAYVMDIIDEDKQRKINKISFIGHSLGGLVQLYAMKYILLTKGEDYFEKHGIHPENLICMASPLLGILTEMSFLISWFLDLGTLGKTGRDLTLLRKIPTLSDLNSPDAPNNKDRFKPILETLPDDPLQTFLGKFSNLTLYANAVNDGIVPLRTSALLYLDWRALGSVKDLKKHKHIETTEDDLQPATSNITSDTVGEIPADESENDDENSATTSVDSYNKKHWSLGDLSQLLLNFHGKHAKDDTMQIKLTNRQKRFLQITAKGSDFEVEDEDDLTNDAIEGKDEDEDDVASKENEQISGFQIPPKANVVESALSALLCPIPSCEYILQPETRDPVIFHDKYYHFDNMPISKEDSSKKSPLFKRVFNYNDWKLHKQVTIAKKYHTRKLTWRKILVNLPPDAHNNIVVRRRFVNGYGWGVIDHLCENFTSNGSKNISIQKNPADNTNSQDSKFSGRAKI